MNTRELTRRRAMKLTAAGAFGAGLLSRTERVAAIQSSASAPRFITAPDYFEEELGLLGRTSIIRSESRCWLQVER